MKRITWEVFITGIMIGVAVLGLLFINGCATSGSFMGGPTKLKDNVYYQYVINSDIDEFYWVSVPHPVIDNKVFLRVKREFPKVITLDEVVNVKVAVYVDVFHCDTHKRDVLAVVYYSPDGSVIGSAKVDESGIPNAEPGVKTAVAQIVEQTVC